MGNWRTLKIRGVTSIEKVVGFFYVWSMKKFPYAKVRVKIVENQMGRYRGIADMGVKRKSDDVPEWAIAEGYTIDDTLLKTTQQLLTLIDLYEAKEEHDFVWMSFKDF